MPVQNGKPSKVSLTRITGESDVYVANYKSSGATGKEIRVRKHGKNPSWVIYFYPGGQLPKELDGQFTALDMATHAISVYLSKKNYGTTS